MRRDFKRVARMLDAAAAAVLAAAVAYAGAALGSVALAAMLAPLAFALAYALLGRIDDQPVHRLAGFEPRLIDAPRPPSARADGDANVIRMFGSAEPASAGPAPRRDAAVAGDAGRALSEALAALRRSLR